MYVKEPFTVVMSERERKTVSLLIVEADLAERHCMKQALVSSGYGTICDAASHSQGLERFAERAISHIIFDARKTTMPAKEFMQKVLEMAPGTIAIPTSGQPDVDGLFDLLILGARGYLVQPFTIETLDDAIALASRCEPVCGALREAADRNEVLAAMVINSLDNLAALVRQARQFDTAMRELPAAIAIFRRSVDAAGMFAKDGKEELHHALENLFLERSKGPASRLGRLRARLRKTRKAGGD